MSEKTEINLGKKLLLEKILSSKSHPKKSLESMKELVAQNYKRETPKLTQILVGSTDRVCENAVICGEFERAQNKIQLAQSQSRSIRQV